MMIFWRYSTEKCHIKLGRANLISVFEMIRLYFAEKVGKIPYQNLFEPLMIIKIGIK